MIREDNRVGDEERVSALDPILLKVLNERDYGHFCGISCRYWRFLLQ